MILLFWAIIAIMTLAALAFVLLPLVKLAKPAYCTAAVITLFFPLFSIALYYHWGSSEKLEHYWLLQRQAAEVKVALAKIKNPEQVVEQLRAHLKADPNSPRGWYLLGKLYLSTGHYARSFSALNKAHKLQPNNNDYATVYAEAFFFNNKKKLSSDMIKLLKNVLNRSPNNIAANNLLAVNAYNQRRYQEAVQYWEKIMPLFAPGSKDSQTLLAMIARAQQQIKKIKESAAKI